MALVGAGWVRIWPTDDEVDAATLSAQAIISGSTEQIRSNWEHLEAVTSGAHVDINTDTHGVHKAGVTAILSIAPCATIYGYTNSGPGSAGNGPGSLAYTTDTGEFLIWRDSTMLLSGSAPAAGQWQSVTTRTSAWSRVRATIATQQIIPSAVWTKINVWEDSGDFNHWDSTGDFADTTGIFTAGAAGYYLITGLIRYMHDELWDGLTNCIHAAAISATGGYYYSYNGAWGPGEASLDLMDLVYLSSGQKLVVCAYHEDSSQAAGLTIQAGNITIVRAL